MKKKLTIGLFLIIMAFTSQAQKIYSIENLDKASQEDLNLYLEKAQKLKKTGGIITIVGSITTITGLLLVSKNLESTFYSGFFLSVTGSIATIAGLTMRFEGSSRVKIVSKFKNTTYNGINMEIFPSSQYNYLAQNYQPGITLRIRF